jgi:cystathionine beta-lyase/cystathionine gamma-synthase
MMKEQNTRNAVKQIIENAPEDWLRLTTHRLDIYDESQAKQQFLEQMEALLNQGCCDTDYLSDLPTAFDYIRLGHPLSSVMEWGVGQVNGIKASQVISFASQTAPLLAVLRMNKLKNIATRVVYADRLPEAFNVDVAREVYGYKFDTQALHDLDASAPFHGTTIVLTHTNNVCHFDTSLLPADFYINVQPELGSIVLVKSANHEADVSEVQHFRRRETIAMTPADCFTALKLWTGSITEAPISTNSAENKRSVLESIRTITGAQTKALVGSSGLSMQYAIVMGLIDDAQRKYPGKAIKIIVPPNCYGGTNDQARRVAASIANTEVVDLPVDREHNMVTSIDTVLNAIAAEDAVPYIIAEIPTNPRVEVPDLDALRDALSKKRQTPSGETAIDPVFILDQTFCPNVHFLGENDMLASVRTIAYVSGSKFPSGGRCTAGYCVANEKAEALLAPIERHLKLSDNEATNLQMEILAEQLPSMNERIEGAYLNTRAFVNFIQEQLPEAKINFVSEELAAQGFRPSVFSLDLPTKGATEAEREAYKRQLNEKLIHKMITEIPAESKYCVSYGQLKGCYWTIPATSTQGTTKEGDKDYIARVSLSQDMDLQKHMDVFAAFVQEINA